MRDDHSARTDGGPVANCNSWKRDAAYAHENSFGKGNLARKVTTRSHVREIPQRTVVVNCRPSVDDAMTANDGVWLDNGSGKNNRAWADLHRFVYVGIWMHYR